MKAFFIVAIFDSIIESFEYLGNELLGNPLLIGAVIFLFFIMLMMLLLLPFEVMVVAMIPLGFGVFEFIPQLRLIFAILAGIVIGLGLIKWYRR